MGSDFDTPLLAIALQLLLFPIWNYNNTHLCVGKWMNANKLVGNLVISYNKDKKWSVKVKVECQLIESISILNMLLFA